MADDLSRERIQALDSFILRLGALAAEVILPLFRSENGLENKVSGGFDPVTRQRVPERRPMPPSHVLVRDYRHPGPVQMRAQELTGPPDQPLPDMDVVFPAGQVHAKRHVVSRMSGRAASAARTRSAVSSMEKRGSAFTLSSASR